MSKTSDEITTKQAVIAVLVIVGIGGGSVLAALYIIGVFS